MGVVQRREGRLVLSTLAALPRIMAPPEEQAPQENYEPGARIKVYIKSVTLGIRGPQVVVSRASPDEMVKKLFTLEIPRSRPAARSVIHNVAREAGSRSKVSVSSTQANIRSDRSPASASAVAHQTIISELGGEKIDIIQ